MQKSKADILIIGDKLNSLKIASDTSLALAEGALQSATGQNFAVWWCEAQDITIINQQVVVTKLTKIVAFNGRQFVTDESHTAANTFTNVKDFYQIWVRKDPPFDDTYKSLCWILAAQKTTNICNPPQVLLTMHEKAIPFLALSQGILNENEVVPTYLLQPGRAKTQQHLIEEFLTSQKNSQGWIAKPWQGHAGRDVQAFAEVNQLLDYLHVKWAASDKAEPLMIQPFLGDIADFGDCRVLVVKGEIVCHFARYPSENRHASNLAQGGRATLQSLTPKQSSVMQRLAKWLWQQNVWLAGVDLIGHKVTEVNITSPTGIRTFEDLTGEKIGIKAAQLLLQGAE